jgi:hypothetical protein
MIYEMFLGMDAKRDPYISTLFLYIGLFFCLLPLTIRVLQIKAFHSESCFRTKTVSNVLQDFISL